MPSFVLFSILRNLFYLIPAGRGGLLGEVKMKQALGFSPRARPVYNSCGRTCPASQRFKINSWTGQPNSSVSLPSQKPSRL